MPVPYWNEQTLTVGELIEELKKLPSSLPVISEGCDCDGTVIRVSVAQPTYSPDGRMIKPGRAYLERDHQ